MVNIYAAQKCIVTCLLLNIDIDIVSKSKKWHRSITSDDSCEVNF